MVSVTAGQPVGLADTRPGCRILDTLDGLSARNDVLRREHDNQGVESLILSTDFSKKLKMPLVILQFRHVPGGAKGTAGGPGVEAKQETTVFDWFWTNSAIWFP